MAGGLLVLFLGMYSWNQRTHTLDDIAANVGLEMSGTVLGTFDSVKGSVMDAWRRYVDLVGVREENERLRREFTANVSHELKTPLTSISGYAEIMKDGLVKSADVPRFANNIYTEAQRLITLVEDILKLSKLDENAVELGRADTDLYAIAQEVASRLKIPAQQNSIVISVQGSSAFVTGVPYILDEMLYNLADNAVKYNRPGGRVVISTGTDGEAACRAVLWAARCCMAAMRDAVPWTGAEAGADVVGADAPLRVNTI